MTDVQQNPTDPQSTLDADRIVPEVSLEQAETLPAIDAEPVNAGEPQAIEPEPIVSNEPADETVVVTEEPATPPAQPQMMEDRPAPTPSPARRASGPGFVPLVLGGAVAAALGFGAAWWLLQQDGPDLEPLLTASADQEARIREVETSLAAIPLPEDSAPEDTVDAVRAEVSETMTAIQTRLDELAATTEARFAEIERAPQVDGTFADEAIAAYDRELDALRTEIAAQQQRMEELTAAATDRLESSVSEAEEIEANAARAAQAAVARAALTRVQAALDTGTAYDGAMSDLAAASETVLPPALSDYAVEGIPTISDLQTSFPPVARDALAAARGAGVAGEEGGRLAAFMRSQFDVRSVTPRDGDTPDAILSRAESALNENRLTDALAEVDSLPEVALTEMADWIALAQTRAAALASYETLSQSLNVN